MGQRQSATKPSRSNITTAKSPDQTVYVICINYDKICAPPYKQTPDDTGSCVLRSFKFSC